MATGRASLPTFATDPDGTVRGGCSFVVRALNGGRWLIVPAHIGIAGDNSSKRCNRDFSQWVDKICVRPTLKTQADIPLFADAKRTIPKFKIVGRDAVADVIALSLPDTAFDEGALLHGVEVIDIPCAYNNDASRAAESYGFPPRDGVGWPYMPPLKTSGAMLTDIFCTFDCADHDTPGFSGAPVFAGGRLAGMFIGSDEVKALLIPAWFIFMLINFDRYDMLPLISVTEWNEKGPNIMGHFTADFGGDALTPRSAIIPNLSADIITTGSMNASLITTGTLDVSVIHAGTITVTHLNAAAASKRSVLQLSGTNIPTSLTSPGTISLTGLTTTDPVDLSISGTYTHSGGATGFKLFLKPTHTWLIDTANVDETGTADGTSQAYSHVFDFTNDVQNKGIFSFALTDWPTTSAPSWQVFGAAVGGTVNYKALFSAVQSYR